jgi:uncharacterized protein YqgV (UPF0045/DUF77 family)
MDALNQSQSVAEVAVEPFASSEDREALIAEAVQAMRGPDVEVRVGPLATTLVGRFDDLIHAAQRAHRAAAAGADRVVTTIRVESKQGGADIEQRDAQVEALQHQDP